MIEQEAARLCEILSARSGVSPLLNLGSADARFREIEQPHIERALFAPLREAGVEIVHADLRPAPGVDIAGDILDPGPRARLRARGFRCLLIANMLEHVERRAEVAAICEEIVGPGGLILATAPSSFPYHADPVDTLYRPTPAQLAVEFGGSDPLLVEEVVGESFAEELARRGDTTLAAIARTALAALAFPVRPKSARARLSRWRWYRRPYRVSIALLRVR